MGESEYELRAIILKWDWAAQNYFYSKKHDTYIQVF